MTTRRKVLFAVANALLGSAVVGTDAFVNAATRPTGDLRVFVAREELVGIRLEPGREDEEYVVTDDDGEVQEFVLDGTGVNSDGFNKAAETRFERLVDLHNDSTADSIEELYFEFDVTDEGLSSTDPDPSDIESVLFIASADGDVPGDGTQDFLAATGRKKVAPNGEVPFGIGIDLGPEGAIQELPDSDKYSVTLDIEAEF